jgi:putative effector of murein hydrolase LrgA (UPF0299 family)
MNRRLAVGYTLTIAILFAYVAIGRGAFPQLDGITSFLVASIVGVAFVPAGILLFQGTKRSSGRLRKILGYSVFALDIALALCACVAIVLIVVSNQRFHDF